MVVRSIGLVLGICALVAAPAHGDDEPPYEPPDFLKELPPLPAGVDASAVWRLDLAEALRLAIHHNLGLAIERQSVEVARLGIDVARGGFEPALAVSAGHNRSDSPPLSAQAGSPGEIVSITGEDSRLTLTQRLPTGTQLGLDFANGRSRSTAGTAVEPLNYLSSVTLSVIQPLLRGFSRDLVVPRIDVLRAEIASERERQQLVVTAAQVVEQTEDAYWGLVQALYQYDLDLRSRRLAEDQLALTHRQIDAGMIPPSDLISAESTLAQRKLHLVSTAQQVEQASDQLRGLVHLPRDQWARPILPTELPRFVAETHRAEDMLEVALHHRPELAQLDLDLRDRELAIRKADNDQLPRIDLGVTGSLTGQDAGYPGAIGEIGRADAPGYSVVLNLSWTPWSRAAGAAAEIERAHQRVALAGREQTLQTVWLAVRDAVRTQHSAALQVTAAARFRELATRSLDVEQRRFLASNSSNFLVAQRQQELATAQLSELSAVLTYKKATAALLRATGRLLDERHIELAVRRAP
jgi:outer membrane protein TolC